MGILSRFFKKSSSAAVNRFDQVTKMTTRLLPIPGLPEESRKFIVITAKRDKNHYWTINALHNGAPVTEGLEAADTALRTIIARHLGKTVQDIGSDAETVDFDLAFKILREMEETMLKHCGYLPDREPRGHFMTAYRLLPPLFQEEIDTSYFQNLRENGWSLPPAPVLTSRGGKSFTL